MGSVETLGEAGNGDGASRCAASTTAARKSRNAATIVRRRGGAQKCLSMRCIGVPERRLAAVGSLAVRPTYPSPIVVPIKSQRSASARESVLAEGVRSQFTPVLRMGCMTGTILFPTSTRLCATRSSLGHRRAPGVASLTVADAVPSPAVGNIADGAPGCFSRLRYQRNGASLDEFSYGFQMLGQRPRFVLPIPRPLGRDKFRNGRVARTPRKTLASFSGGDAWLPSMSC